MGAPSPPLRSWPPETLALTMTSTLMDAGMLSPASPSVPESGGFPLQPSTASSAALAAYPASALGALETYKKKDASKVVVRFKAIGNAPIMKNNYFRITAFNRFQAVIQFLRKELGWKQGDALVRAKGGRSARTLSYQHHTSPFQFLYVNSSFSPAPDDSVGNLFRVSGQRVAQGSAGQLLTHVRLSALAQRAISSSTTRRKPPGDDQHLSSFLYYHLLYTLT